MVNHRPLRRTLISGLLSASLVGAVAARPVPAQRPSLSGYYLNLGAGVGESSFSDRVALNFQRIRLMGRPRIGPVSFELAYEHTFLLNSNADDSGIMAGGAPTSALEWLALDWTLQDTDPIEWRHRFDRLNLSAAVGPLRVRIGRQAISWATTLFLTPADPFTPFDPSDSFREFRGGVDALRIQVFPSPFSEADLVLRPARSATDTTLTGLVRGSITVGNWDLSGWGGILHDAPAGALGATTTLGATAIRSEVSVREDPSGGAILRAALGLDRRFLVLDRLLFIALEYQYDGFGASSSDDFANVVGSAQFRRGELQALGRETVTGNLSFEAGPRFAAHLFGIWNRRDGSAILGPSASVSVSAAVSARVGVFTSLGGDELGPTGLPTTEHGATPNSAFGAVNVFF